MTKRISVCMATFNGAKYIKRQLDTILSQLTNDDEVIITDDGSTDNTLDIIASYNSPLISVHVNPVNLGYVQNFSKAMMLAKGKYIFLADQDDIWAPNKVAKVMAAFDSGASFVYHDAIVIDDKEAVLSNSWWDYAGLNPETGVLRNFRVNNFSGCMMAMTAALRDQINPIPQVIDLHDEWIFLIAKRTKMPITIIHEPLMQYARHGENNSGLFRRPTAVILKGRIGTILHYYTFRKKKNR